MARGMKCICSAIIWEYDNLPNQTVLVVLDSD